MERKRERKVKKEILYEMNLSLSVLSYVLKQRKKALVSKYETKRLFCFSYFFDLFFLLHRQKKMAFKKARSVCPTNNGTQKKKKSLSDDQSLVLSHLDENLPKKKSSVAMQKTFRDSVPLKKKTVVIDAGTPPTDPK